MASKKGIDSVLAKLQASIEQGDYYAAQQMYKTLHFRYSAKHQHDDLVKLLTQGSLLMLQHGQVNEGSELALLLLEHYKSAPVACSAQSLEPLIKIFNSFPDAADANQRRTFVKTAISWSSSPSNNDQGAPELHDVFARFYSRTDKALAEKHFLRGSSGQIGAFVDMLLAWSDEGFPNERDLFLARSVFQYLCLSNLKDARSLFTGFLTKRPIDSPLINFTRFLLEVVQHDAYPLFQKLRSSYAASLQRDQNFSKYMDMIGKVYFNVEPQNRGGMGGLLGGMLRSFLGGDM